MSTAVSAFRATNSRPCPVCGWGTKGCSVKDDGLHWCRGEPADSAAWKCVKRGDTFNSYRPVDDDHRDDHRDRPPQPKQKAPPKDWSAEAAKYAKQLTPARAEELANLLGLPADALAALPVGWSGSTWTFPELDGAGHIIGISTRDRDGKKKCITGSRRGLMVPDGWSNRPGPRFLVEGASDTLTGCQVGLSVIGRPSNTGGTDKLAVLLRDDGREIIVVGENDQKEDGTWPGRDGASGMASDLMLELGRPVSWSMPPEDYKDLRQWVADLAEGSGDAIDWHGIGEQVTGYIKEHALEVRPPRTSDRVTIGELIDAYPTLHEPLIDGLIRRGETANVISHSKVGKSWLGYGLLLSYVTRRTWLNRFPTAGGRVLLIDNELHRATLANRIKSVASAMGIANSQYRDALEVLPIRGKGLSIYELRDEFDRIQKGEFGLILLDAKYRLLPPDTSENDNAAETRFYNELDRIAESTGSAIINIHHTSKGDQANKRVTDVGAGAGAQSRAADAHIVLREHDEDDSVVLAAAIRSFAPVDPVGLRWQFPVWVPDETLDTDALKGSKSRSAEEQDARDAEADEVFLKHCEEWASAREIANASGLGHARITKAAWRLLEQKKVEKMKETRRGSECHVFRRLVSSDSSCP